ncbi:MAG: thiazole biosynthesis adenylyltransferase ThiF [Chloroflexi bacterium]|nr:thiazole biosynthesis adenylyltransferase ThiF [Chloroflexota bacterium]
MTTPDLRRYQRQIIFRELGEEGQRKLLASRVAVVGVGATGSTIANWLVRAGVGYVRLIDRDFVELHNLHRQSIYDEDDVREGLPKAVAAARKLARVNSDVQVEPVVADFNPDNALELVEGVDLIMDGSDNFFTRYLINDVSLYKNIPWVYTGALAAYGSSATFIPHDGACFRCIFDTMPAPGQGDTCETVGVLGPVVGVIASFSAGEGMKVLTGMGKLNRGLIYFDLLANSWDAFQVERRPDCPACGQGKYEFLHADVGTWITRLCGRDTVQILVRTEKPIDLKALAERLRNHPDVQDLTLNEYLLRFRVDGREITLFPDARAIIKGGRDEEEAKSLYARFVGY